MGRALSSAELALFCIGRAVSSLRNLQTMPCYCHSEGSAYLPSLHLSLMMIIIPHHHCVLCYCLHLSNVIIIPGLLVYGVLIARGACLKERERDIEGGKRIQGADPFPIIMVLILIIMMIFPIIMVNPSSMMIVLIMVHGAFGALIARWVCLGERYREGEGET